VQLLDVIDLGPETKQKAEPYLPRFEFLLDDLPEVGDAQLRDRGMTPEATVTLVVLKNAPRNPRVATALWHWSDQLRAVLDQPGGVAAFKTLLKYIESVSETPASDLHDLVASLGPDAEKVYMTTADMLRAEGEARALVKMLTVKFGPLPENVAKMVQAASADEIDAWMTRSVTAETLDEVFR
jgi:hypothetical protein